MIVVAEEMLESIEEVTPPSVEVAQRALGKVSFEDRLVAYRMSAAAGTLRVDLYSFAEVGRYLAGTRWRNLEAPDARVDINWVDPNTLTSWVHNVIGDVPLADAMRDSLSDPELSFREQVLRMTPLMAERYAQYEALVPTEAEVSE